MIKKPTVSDGIYRNSEYYCIISNKYLYMLQKNLLNFYYEIYIYTFIIIIGVSNVHFPTRSSVFQRLLAVPHGLPRGR